MGNEQWLVKDKGWVIERQVGWQRIKQRLDISERFTKKELKILENYYLKGKEPKWDREWDDDPIPLFFRLWFDPDQNLEHWQSIMDEVFAYPQPYQVGHSLTETYDILWGEANNSVSYSGLNGLPNGFMGGGEKKMFDLLIGPPDCENNILYHGKELTKRLFFNKGYYRSMASWLNIKVLQNHFKINLYSLEHWYARLTDEKCEELKMDTKRSPTGEESVLEYLSIVARYHTPEESSEDFIRQDYCNKVRDILNGRPLPTLMKQWWEEAKT